MDANEKLQSPITVLFREPPRAERPVRYLEVKILLRSRLVFASKIPVETLF